ncbi:hypothetical protein D3C80_2085570 [compost metagenome]
MDAASIAACIGRLISDTELRNRLSEKLSRTPLGTEDEISKLYSLLGQVNAR